MVRRIFPSRPNRSAMRKPDINYHLKMRPYQIQPFFCHPVLPGERLNNVLWKSNAVSDPVANRLMGWWMEHHLFYVRFRDLFPANDIKSIFTDPTQNLATLYSAADAKYFHKYGVNWAKEATRLVVENYFRAESEDAATYMVDGMFAASVGTDNLLDSTMMAAALMDQVDVEVDDDGDGVIMMSEIERAQRLYEELKVGGFTDMDYNDFLRTYGIRLPSEEQEGKPKHLRTIKNWQMPVNHIDESTGAATTAMYWKTEERHDKDFMVKEPGFLIGFIVFKPKVLLANQTGSLIGIMDTLREWLPAVLRDDPTSSMIILPDGGGPFAITGEVAQDLKDLLVYGEQFTNIAPVAGNMNVVALPKVVSGELQKRYPDLTDAKSVFKNASGENEATEIEIDGKLQLSLSTAIRDDGTPPISRLAV